MNVALHGLEAEVKKVSKVAAVIRYADDFVILHHELGTIERCKSVVEDWLRTMGLELKPSKTRITHTLEKYGNNDNPGFYFLGCFIRQYKVGKHNSGKGTNLGFKTLIKPSPENVKRHCKRIGEIISSNKATSQQSLIALLNPVITGWSRYFAPSVSKRAYSAADTQTFSQLRRWAFHRHADKPRSWIVSRYWMTIGNRNWVFGTKVDDNLLYLARHDRTNITRHIKIQGSRSIFDGDWIYWSKRMGRYPGTPDAVAKLVKDQKGKCSRCKKSFVESDTLRLGRLRVTSSLKGKKQQKTFLFHANCNVRKCD